MLHIRIDCVESECTLSIHSMKVFSQIFFSAKVATFKQIRRRAIFTNLLQQFFSYCPSLIVLYAFVAFNEMRNHAHSVNAFVDRRLTMRTRGSVFVHMTREPYPNALLNDLLVHCEAMLTSVFPFTIWAFDVRRWSWEFSRGRKNTRRISRGGKARHSLVLHCAFSLLWNSKRKSNRRKCKYSLVLRIARFGNLEMYV